MDFSTVYYQLDTVNNLITQPFKYSVRIGNEYIVRSDSDEKIGMAVARTEFITLTGEKVAIGGKQAKPTVINLWFVGCKGCVQEMPVLNKLQEKYGKEVNFLALTFNDEDRVSRFLNKTQFNYDHIVNAGDFIELIGSQPYPENIFINKEGKIENIEGILSEANLSRIKYFETLIEKLL